MQKLLISTGRWLYDWIIHPLTWLVTPFLFVVVAILTLPIWFLTTTRWYAQCKKEINQRRMGWGLSKAQKDLLSQLKMKEMECYAYAKRAGEGCKDSPAKFQGAVFEFLDLRERCQLTGIPKSRIHAYTKGTHVS